MLLNDSERNSVFYAKKYEINLKKCEREMFRLNVTLTLIRTNKKIDKNHLNLCIVMSLMYVDR